MLIEPVEGMSYATILHELKKHVNPDELGATVQGIRETRSKDLLVEIKCSAKSRGRLDTAFKEVIVARGARSSTWNPQSKRKTSKMPSEASSTKNRSWS